MGLRNFPDTAQYQMGESPVIPKGSWDDVYYGKLSRLAELKASSVNEEWVESLPDLERLSQMGFCENSPPQDEQRRLSDFVQSLCTDRYMNALLLHHNARSPPEPRIAEEQRYMDDWLGNCSERPLHVESWFGALVAPFIHKDLTYELVIVPDITIPLQLRNHHQVASNPSFTNNGGCKVYLLKQTLSSSKDVKVYPLHDADIVTTLSADGLTTAVLRNAVTEALEQRIDTFPKVIEDYEDLCRLQKRVAHDSVFTAEQWDNDVLCKLEEYHRLKERKELEGQNYHADLMSRINPDDRCFKDSNINPIAENITAKKLKAFFNWIRGDELLRGFLTCYPEWSASEDSLFRYYQKKHKSFGDLLELKSHGWIGLIAAPFQCGGERYELVVLPNWKYASDEGSGNVERDGCSVELLQENTFYPPDSIQRVSHIYNDGASHVHLLVQQGIHVAVMETALRTAVASRIKNLEVDIQESGGN